MPRGVRLCEFVHPVERPTTSRAMEAEAENTEPRGCLFALSQPPLMLFLTVIGGLLGAGALYDLRPFF
ncbi:MAG: hypothetical protein QOF84_7264 [Streptomyces sp.]|nr:hypothetical protein [Streptomyces sp.]